MPSVGCSEHQRLNLSTEELLQKGVQGPNPGAFMRRGRKYFNTDACNIKGAKAVCTAIIRVLDERAGGDASEGAYTRVNHPSRVCTCTRVHEPNLKIYVAYLRVRKARTFTGAREIIYSGIDFLASDALSCHSALTIHLQRPTRLARRIATLISRNEKNGERLADAFSANERRNDTVLFRARKNTALRNY